MKDESKTKIKVVWLMITFTLLFFYAFYIHKNESHWFDAKNVINVK